MLTRDQISYIIFTHLYPVEIYEKHLSDILDRAADEILHNWDNCKHERVYTTNDGVSHCPICKTSKLGFGTSPVEKVYQNLSPSEYRRLIEGEW